MISSIVCFSGNSKTVNVELPSSLNIVKGVMARKDPIGNDYWLVQLHNKNVAYEPNEIVDIFSSMNLVYSSLIFPFQYNGNYQYFSIIGSTLHAC
jgi:hypothetical protein